MTRPASRDYQAAIETLSRESSQKQIDDVLAVVAAAFLLDTELARALKAISKKTEMTIVPVRQAYNRMRLITQGVARTGATSGGRMVFAYENAFNYDEAFDITAKAFIAKNTRDKLPTFCQLQGTPVRLSIENGHATFNELGRDGVWAEANKLITYIRRTDGGDGPREPVDKNVALGIYETAYEAFPPAPEVIHSPRYQRDGSLLIKPGYHARSNVLVLLNDLKISDLPNPPVEARVKVSVDWFRKNILSGFPFLDIADDGTERREPSEANAFAMILTPFLRRMIDGPTPFFLITKPQAGTGGSLLGAISMLLFDGEESAPMNYTHDEDEMQKQFVAAFMQPRSHMFFDDIKNLDNRSLIRALTSSKIGGRMLKSSKLVKVRNDFNWIGTGNNPRFGDEMRRRICMIRLNAKKANLTKRKFEHDDLKKFIRENRATAIYHLCVMVEYWKSKGCPEFTQRKRASFEDWGKKVGGVLEVCGITGFLDDTVPVTLDADSSRNIVFCVEWLKMFGVEAKRTPDDLFRWALDAVPSVTKGKGDDDKWEKFADLLVDLTDFTFESGDKNYSVRASIADGGGTEYSLQEVEESAAIKESV